MVRFLSTFYCALKISSEVISSTLFPVAPSINLFPTEDKQTLRADKLNISFCFASYSSSLTIKDANKELTIYLDEKVVMSHVLNSITNLNVSYSSNRDYMIELFKKVVAQIDQMENKDKEVLASYFVKNINTTKEVNK